MSRDVCHGKPASGILGQDLLSSKSLFYKLTLGILFTNVWLCPSLAMADPGHTLHWLNRETQILLLETVCPLRPEQMLCTQGQAGLGVTIRVPLDLVQCRMKGGSV